MTTKTDAAQRLREWAVAAGGEQLQRLGYAAIEAIRTTPAANDPDWPVEAWRIAGILDRMARDGRAKEAKVLAVEYLSPGLTEAERLKRLRREGLSVGRTAYYIYLDAAHAYVQSAIPGDDPCES